MMDNDDLGLPLTADDLTELTAEELDRSPKYAFYNSLSKRSDNPVHEILGYKNIPETIESILKKYTDVNLPFITFQVSSNWISTESQPKPSDKGTPVNAKRWGSKYPDEKKTGIYEGITWNTVRTSLNVIPEMIQSGLALRYGVKEGGNDLKHFINTQCFGFDLDADPSVTWEDTLKLFLRYHIDPLVIYYSPSGNEENNKLRAIVALDRPLSDYKFCDQLLKRICQILPNATPFGDSTRFWYGTVKPIPYVSKRWTLNSVEKLEENLPPLLEDDSESLGARQEEDSLSFQHKVCNYLRDKVIDPIYSGDISKMIDSWIDYLNTNEQASLYKGEWIEEHQDGNALISWNGTNPIRGGTGKHGISDSFTVSLMADGSMQYSIDHSEEGGDLIQLYYFMKSGSFDVNLPSRVDWRSTLHEICELHSIPKIENQTKKQKETRFDDLFFPFIEETDKGGVKLLIRELVNYFYEQKRGYIYYSDVSKCYWVYLPHPQIPDAYYWAECDVSYLIDMVERIVEFAEDRLNDAYSSEDSEFVIRLWNAQAIKNVKTHLKDCFPNEWKKKEVLRHDVRYMPFSNGLFDTRSKQLIDFTPEVVNNFVHPFPFEPVEGDKPKETYYRIYSKVFKHGRKAAEAVLNWAICCLQGRAYETRLILSMVGKSRSGKSTFANILMNYLGEGLSTSADADLLFKKGANFANNAVRNKVLVFLDEFTELGKESSLGKLKKFVTGDNSAKGVLLPIEIKGGQHGSFWFQGGIITTSEDRPNFGKTIDEGTRNRFLWIDVVGVPKSVCDLSVDFEYLQTSKEFFFWLLQQETDHLIEDYFANIKSDDWVIETDKIAILESNRYARFLDECLIYDLDRKGGTAAGELYSFYCEWCEEQNERPQSAKFFGQETKKLIATVYNVKEEEVVKRAREGIIYQHIFYDKHKSI